MEHKFMKGKSLNQAEIERYWGSLEAYQEEQRRVGLCELEALQPPARKNVETFPLKKFFPRTPAVPTPVFWEEESWIPLILLKS